MVTGALLLGAAGASHAQETMGGLAAAGAAGATLGAVGAGGLSGSQATRGLPPAPGGMGGSMDGGPSFPGGPAMGGGGMMGGPGMGGGGTTTTTTTTAVRPPAPEIYSGTGSSFVNELMAASRSRVPATRVVRRSPRAQARYAARVARLSKTQRTRGVQAKYRVAPVGWKAAYLPQDRYKFGKIWRFVSTETDRFYYTPSGMARRRFNPNRVIGFNSYQDALLAGYRPDPATRPAPGAQIAYLARLYRGPELDDFVSYVYAGQIAPGSLNSIVSYASSVERTLRPTRARPYIGSTVAKVLEAALTGDQSIIPRRFDANGPIVTTTTTTIQGGGSQFPGSSGRFPGAPPQFPGSSGQFPGGAPRGGLMPPSIGATPGSAPPGGGPSRFGAGTG